MKEYDLRNAGHGCINNAILALIDIFNRREESFSVLLRKEDLDRKTAEAMATVHGYRLESFEDHRGFVRAAFRRV